MIEDDSQLFEQRIASTTTSDSECEVCSTHSKSLEEFIVSFSNPIDSTVVGVSFA